MLTCPSCEAANDDQASACARCGEDLIGLGPGSVVADRYEVLSLLGEGGMGMVFKARDRQLDEVVALKVLRTDAAITPEMSRRFRAEIKLARKVTHKNVCRIHEYGQHGDLQYISMAYVDGVDLKHILREQGALSPDEAYAVAIAVAEGLQAVHDEGIVHRDLKTPNIMRDGRGVVRLMDFGIAKQWEEGAPSLTATGMIVGTPEYMSPEQCRGLKVDARSDLYALGIVVYELFTGRVPFRGDAAITTIIKHLQEAPPLEGPEATGIPPALIPILARCLAKTPEERYASAREVAAALSEARTGYVPSPAAAPGPNVISNDAPPDMPTVASRVRRVAAPTLPAARVEPGGAIPADEGPTTIVPAAPAPPAALRRPTPPGGAPTPRPTSAKPPAPAPPAAKGGPSPAILGLGGLVVVGLLAAAYFGLMRRTTAAPTASATPAPSVSRPPEAQASSFPLVNPASPIRVGLKTEEGKMTYSIGQKEKATFVVSSDTAGYLYLLAFSANDVAGCIFPRGASADNQIQPGTPRKFTVPAEGEPSRDTVVALVSTTPLKLGDKAQYTHQEVFGIVKGSSGTWQSAVLPLETTK